MKTRLLLLTGAALLLVTPAFAQSGADIAARLDRMQKMLDAQQKQIEAQKAQIAKLMHKRVPEKEVVQTAVAPLPQPPLPAAQPSPAVAARLATQDQKIDDMVAAFAAQKDVQRLATQEQPLPSVTNGRLQIASADGRFSAALRLTTQIDTGYVMQANRARALSPGPDLSSGSNFRRAQIGLQGKLFGDFSYYVNIDYGSGGSTGTESPGHLQQAYIEYDGLAPFLVRIGAHPPSTGLDDSYAATDQLFLERASPADATRNMAGGDGRNSLELLYTGDNLFASLALTGDKVQETTLLFDEQQAAVARIADVLFANSDWRLVASAAATDVFRPGDSTAALSSPRPFSISNPPEEIFDDQSTKFVTASGANVTDAWNWNLESAVTYDNFLAQGGYFRYGLDLRGQPTLRGEDFSGWYGEASWVLSGESRGWSTATAAFTSPKPRVNFALEGGGWGAWEVAARYSDLDLNDNGGALGVATPAGGVRGGEQRIVTVGLNWYPNPVLKFMLQGQNTHIGRVNSAAPFASLGQNFDTIALRSQLAF